MKTEWDYTDRAHTYDQRADYSDNAINNLLNQIGSAADKPVADIGAGTGKLTKLLLNYGLTVTAVEPNENMRMYGVDNTSGQKVTWIEGVGEKTGLPDNSMHAVFFGSSFNVVDQTKALTEAARVLVPNGWFSCMWNHRDINDPTQKLIEQIIHSYIPHYEYGLRRKDPSDAIESSQYFCKTSRIEEKFFVPMTKNSVVDAWKSHDTLFRQSDGKFGEIIDAISDALTEEEYLIPYFTRIWFAQRK